MIIEWNTHMFSSDTERYPFHAAANYRPEPSRLSADPLSDYVAHMDSEGIDKAVLVHPEPYGDDHGLVRDCLVRDPQRFRITSLFYPRDPLAPEKLKDLATSEPGMVSTRFHAYHASSLRLGPTESGKEGQYLDRFTDDNVIALWEMAVSLGLIVELHIGPKFAREVGTVLAARPETTVIIDHLAEPQEGTGPEFANVLALSEFENVYMKLSGFGHFASDAPLYEDAGPFTKWVVDAFGPDRLVWGGGSPAIVDTHMAGYSEQDRAKVKGLNLQKLLDW
jgi:predicted TIM-barrel fold metal-dependent hydrolase